MGWSVWREDLGGALPGHEPHLRGGLYPMACMIQSHLCIFQLSAAQGAQGIPQVVPQLFKQVL